MAQMVGMHNNRLVLSKLSFLDAHGSRHAKQDDPRSGQTGSAGHTPSHIVCPASTEFSASGCFVVGFGEAVLIRVPAPLLRYCQLADRCCRQRGPVTAAIGGINAVGRLKSGETFAFTGAVNPDSVSKECNPAMILAASLPTRTASVISKRSANRSSSSTRTDFKIGSTSCRRGPFERALTTGPSMLSGVSQSPDWIAIPPASALREGAGYFEPGAYVPLHVAIENH